jgi:hypothetical protein
MMPDPIDRYEFERKRQQQVWNDAEQERQVKEAAAQRSQRTAHLRSRVGSLLGALALWLKARGKGSAALAGSHHPEPMEAPARSCQGSIASTSHHPCVLPIAAKHPPHAA